MQPDDQEIKKTPNDKRLKAANPSIVKSQSTMQAMKVLKSLLLVVFLAVAIISTFVESKASRRSIQRRATNPLVFGPFGTSRAGKPFKFECAPGAYITHIQGTVNKYPGSLKFFCSDGDRSFRFGDLPGESFKVKILPHGKSLINVKAGIYVEALTVFGPKFEKQVFGKTDGSGKDAPACPASFGKCLLVGAFGRTSTYIDQLNLFLFIDNGTNQINERDACGIVEIQLEK
ncbi:hypothetical protein HDU97_000353 [Phlyctochytrium planicorne]|nr:hypothetical protein HDU97_000353 [Phlyctochytrium planicorne]